MSEYNQKLEETLKGSVLSKATTTLIKCTAPGIKANGAAIVKSFHQILTGDHPVFKSIFPAESIQSDKQIGAVVDTLYHYAVNCDNLVVLDGEISDLISMAVNLDMEGWHYPLIAKSVVDALGAVLKGDTTPESLNAWMDGLSFLATHFVRLADEFKKNPYYKAWRLSEDTIKHLKESAPEIAEKGTLIATKMFTILFERYPVFKELFPKDNVKSGKMVAVLPHALHSFASSCDNLIALEDTIQRIVNRHVNSGVQHWHYPLLEECFISALNSTLSLSQRPELMHAWRQGFKFLANKVMKLESIKRNNPIVNVVLDPVTIRTLKSSAMLFKTQGDAILSHFYTILFERYPVFKGLFKPENVESGKQVKAMAIMLSKFAANCDNMAYLEGPISHIVGMHVGRKLGVENWHYPLVGECLIEAIRTVLDTDASPALINAWTKGYKFLSNHFMNMEDAFRENPYYKYWTLTPQTIEVIKSTAPVIKAKGPAIASKLYTLLFTRHEVFKAMFPVENTQSGKMVNSLPTALYDFALNCDNMEKMETTISRVASRHVGQGVQDWHYPMLAECFKEAFRVVLEKDATPAVIEAWDEGFKLFANQIMKVEDLKRNN